MKRRWESGVFDDAIEQNREVKMAALRKIHLHPGFSERQAETLRRRWENGEFDDPDYRAMLSRKAKKMWEDEDFREQMSEATKERWCDPSYQEFMSEAITEAHNRGDYTGVHRSPSKLALSVAKVLRHLGFKNEIEYRVENRSYDIYVPDLNLLIEVDGEYWHYSEAAIERGSPELDRRKRGLALSNGFRFARLREREIHKQGAGKAILSMLRDMNLWGIT